MSSEHLVVGGGLAGAMTALRLARAGREVVLLERERAPHHKVCGEFLSPEAVEYLRQAGVDPANLGAVEIGRLRLAAGNRVIEADLPFRALSLSRCVLDAEVLARAADIGCEVRCGQVVQRLSREGDRFIAEPTDGPTLKVRNVFLATGKHDLRGWGRPDGRQGDLVGFKMLWRLRAGQTTALRGFMDLYLFAGGYGGLSLVEGDTANLCLVVRRARLRQLGDWRGLLAGLRDENALVGERLAGAETLWERPLAISSIPYGYLTGDQGGVWRVGDQAAVIPSFTGDGMAIALHSGSLAAEMCLEGKTPGQYHKELSRQLGRGMSIATFLSRAMVNGAARKLAPALMSLLPRPIDWIARATRIPPGAICGVPGLSI